MREAGTAPDESVPILVRDEDTTLEGSTVPTVSLATSSPEAMKALAIAEPFHIPPATVPRYEVPEMLRLVVEAFARVVWPVTFKVPLEVKFDDDALPSTVWPVTPSVPEKSPVFP